MCSIYGAYSAPGRQFDFQFLEALAGRAKDRGRDGGGIEVYELEGGATVALGNWRATPTPEVQDAPPQPYEGLVHNGTIANDKELGGRLGEVDSEVLARVLDRSSAPALAESLGKVQGSYALACHNNRSLLLACNYKPVHYYSPTPGVVYFSSMERHFRGLLPFGQSPVQLPPYSVLDLRSGESTTLPRKEARRAVVVCSGGLDSATVVGMLADQGYSVRLLHFRYSCRAEGPEARAVAALAGHFGCPYSYLDLPYRQLAGGSSLLAAGAAIAGGVAGAEYAHEWVPARNLVFASLALAFAEANSYHAVALGTNLEESGAYPDNEEQFTHLLDRAADYAVQNGVAVRVLSPVGKLMKHEIVREGLRLQVPYRLTYSCYKGGERHCGECGPCFMRAEAFRRNGVADPVLYEEKHDLALAT